MSSPSEGRMNHNHTHEAGEGKGMRNPTVALNLTRRELKVLSDLLGHGTGCLTLRDKLSDARKAMVIENRQANREAKIARHQKARTPKASHEAPANAGASLMQGEK